MEEEWIIAGVTDLRDNLNRLENPQTTLDQFWDVFNERDR